MRRLVPFLPLVAAIALLLSGALESLRFDASPAAAKEQIVVIEHATTDAVIDLGDEGDSVGDSLVFSNEVYDSNDASVVGSDQGSCVRTKKGKAWECTFTVSLDDGSLTVQGPFYDDGSDSSLAITGGTGNYSGATGQMTLSANGEEEYQFAFDIN